MGKIDTDKQNCDVGPRVWSTAALYACPRPPKVDTTCRQSKLAGWVCFIVTLAAHYVKYGKAICKGIMSNDKSGALTDHTAQNEI